VLAGLELNPELDPCCYKAYSASQPMHQAATSTSLLSCHGHQNPLGLYLMSRAVSNTDKGQLRAEAALIPSLHC